MKDQITKLFTAPSPAELASKELAEAERELLAAQTAVDYSQAMVCYNRDRITRLRSFLAITAKE